MHRNRWNALERLFGGEFRPAPFDHLVVRCDDPVLEPAKATCEGLGHEVVAVNHETVEREQSQLLLRQESAPSLPRFERVPLPSRARHQSRAQRRARCCCGSTAGRPGAGTRHESSDKSPPFDQSTRRHQSSSSRHSVRTRKTSCPRSVETIRTSTRTPSDFSHTQKLQRVSLAPLRVNAYSSFSSRSSERKSNETGCEPGNLSA